MLVYKQNFYYRKGWKLVTAGTVGTPSLPVPGLVIIGLVLVINMSEASSKTVLGTSMSEIS